METFSVDGKSLRLTLCEGIHRSRLDSSHKGPMMPRLDTLFEVIISKLLNKESRRQWIETLWRSSDVTDQEWRMIRLAACTWKLGSNKGRVTHICVSDHWFRWCLVAWSAPSHYLNQCYNIFNWTLRNKLQWYFNRKSYISKYHNIVVFNWGSPTFSSKFPVLIPNQFEFCKRQASDKASMWYTGILSSCLRH